MLKTTFTNTKQDKDFMSSIVNVLSGSSITHPSSPNVQINEKLDDDDAHEVENYWDTERSHHTQSAIDKTFGDKSRIEFPMHAGEEVPHPDVEDHLNKNGYAITDYTGGKAKDKFNREVNIGKALTKTKATPDIKAAYDNDPSRQQRSKDGLKVVITHRPADVAGMTSGHQSWVEQSCMNFKTGSYRNKLEDDIREGTHVAYLTTHDDKDLDKPLARVAIKPFHSASGHTIFRPEHRVYGSAHDAFHKNVSDWCEKHYEAEPDETYTKNHKVYDDTGDTEYNAMTKETADYHIKNNRQILNSVPTHIVDHIANSLIKGQQDEPTGDTMDQFARGGHNVAFNRNQVNALYKVAKEHGQIGMTHTLSSKAGDTLNKDNLTHAIANHPNSRSVLRHKYLPSEFVDNLPVSKLTSLHPSNIKPHHVDKIIDDYLADGSGSWYNLRDVKERLTKPNLMKLTNKAGTHIIRLICGHKNADQDVHAAVFNKIKSMAEGNDKQVVMSEFNETNKNPTPEHVAHTESDRGLRHIMNNAPNNFIHGLAFQKSMSKSKEPLIDQNGHARSGGRHVVMLGDNSNKHLSDTDIKDIYENHQNVSMGHTMPNDVHDRVLKHSMNEIDATHAKLHPKDMFDEHPDNYTHSDEYRAAYDHVQNHFDKHADLINDKLADMASDFRSGDPVDEEHFHQLGSHIDAAREHPGHEGSHDDVHSDHQQLESDIEDRHENGHNNW